MATQLKAQYARGAQFFISDSAFDRTSLMNLLDPLLKAQCPMPDEWPRGFVTNDPAMKASLDPLLYEHRDRIFEKHFRSPMELWWSLCALQGRT